jgi:glycosyltransferase involved in cell wall biosynthesis
MELTFSVIIPIYNAEKYISQAINSVLDQGFDDYELILIDDGSTDNSPEICKTFLNRPNVNYFRQENKGLLVTRGVGLNIASGEYIIWLDADDYLEKEYLKIVYARILESHADIYVINAFHVSESHSRILYCRNFQDNSLLVGRPNTEIIKLVIQDYSMYACWIKIAKRSIYKISEQFYIKFKDVKCGEDLLQTLELLDNAESICFINKPLYNYRFVSGSMSRNIEVGYFQSFEKVIAQLIEYLYKWTILELIPSAKCILLKIAYQDYFHMVKRFHRKNKLDIQQELKDIQTSLIWKDALKNKRCSIDISKKIIIINKLLHLRIINYFTISIIEKFKNY